MNMHELEVQDIGNGMLRVTRSSPLNGATNSMDLPISPDQLQEFCTGGPGGRKIQQIFPSLNSDQREFLQTGYTPDDWKVLFPEGPTLIHVGLKKLVKVGDKVEAHGKKATIKAITYKGCAQVVTEDGTGYTWQPHAFGAKWIGKDEDEVEDEDEDGSEA